MDILLYNHIEKEMATHSSTLAWKIPWEEPGRLQSMGHKESDMTERLHFNSKLINGQESKYQGPD